MKSIVEVLVLRPFRVLMLLCVAVLMVSGVLSAAPISVGDEYGGGKVVYILQPGDPGYKADEPHGLIAAKEDLPQESLSWFEAKAAAERMEIGGNKGWSLPSEKELSLLYRNKDAVGGFREFSYYWSGSEVGRERAVTLDFFNGDRVESVKSGSMPGIRRIRVVRKF